MNSLNRKPVKFLVLLIAIFVMSGCANNNSNLDELSKNYKQNHDYMSLVSILPYLNYTMTRSKVEDLLGTPMYCPMPHQCYYSSNQSVIVSCQNTDVVSKETCQSFPLVLVVTYNMSDDANISSQDNLANFLLGPVGE